MLGATAKAREIMLQKPETPLKQLGQNYLRSNKKIEFYTLMSQNFMKIGTETWHRHQMIMLKY